MDIAAWRRKIDEIDRKLVELLNQRARAAHEIGRLKHGLHLPVYEPDREQTVFQNVGKANAGPLPAGDLERIYERILDIMRKIQKEEDAPRPKSAGTGDPESDGNVND